MIARLWPLLFALGCTTAVPPASDGAGALDLPVPADGGAAPPLYAAFTVTGCETLVFEEAAPRCEGPAPLRLQLIPISAGGERLRWQLWPEEEPDGGAAPILGEAQSREPAPLVELPLPGRYRVQLAVGGPGGTASAVGAIVVRPAAIGAPCEEDRQCDAGLRCLCGRRTPEGALCPEGLQEGLCTRGCEGAPCPEGTECLDLSRGAPTPDGGDGPPFRRPLCASACRGGLACRRDLLCRELPVRAPAPRFAAVCFLGQPAAVGEACAGPGGDPDPAACATGLCEPLGARGLCTWACDPVRRDCPSTAACARWNGGAGAPAGPRCLARCDGMRPCQDPLLQCQQAGGGGALGFQLPGEGAGAMVCAPRRCSGPADCKTGRCVTLGAASFCLR